MTSLLAAILFAGFVTTAVLVPVRRTRGAVSVFIGWSLLASFGPGLIQKDAWPFVSWPLVAGIHPETVTHPRLVAVDAAGGEHDIDYRAFEPLGVDEFHAWLKRTFAGLNPQRREAAAAWLLDRAESARRLALAGERPSTRTRLLGPLEAPLFVLHPPLWDDPAEVPADPLVGLRLYLETWDMEARARGGGPVDRSLLYESPALGEPAGEKPAPRDSTGATPRTGAAGRAPGESS